MAAAVVQRVGANPAAEDILVLPAFGAGVTSGNSVVVMVMRATTDPAITNVTDNQSNTYSLVATETASDNIGSFFRCDNIANAPTVITITLAGDAFFWVGAAYETTPLGAFSDSNTAQGGTGAAATVDVTAAAEGALLIGELGIQDTKTVAGSSGATAFPLNADPGGPWGLDRAAGAAGAQSLGGTWTGNAPWEIFAASFEEGEVAGGGVIVPAPPTQINRRRIRRRGIAA